MGCLFEAGHLHTFWALRVGGYSRWALIRRWALNRINMVIDFALSMYILCSLLASYLLVSMLTQNKAFIIYEPLLGLKKSLQQSKD